MKLAYPFLLLFLMAGCITSKVNNKKFPLFDKQGHRGSRGLMPENTIPAMLTAIDLRVTTLELDVLFTKDGVAIASHEPYFNHAITTKKDGTAVTKEEEKTLKLYNMTFAQTQQYDVGLRGNPAFPHQNKMAVAKPSLAALIDSVESYVQQRRLRPVFYNIETKTKESGDNIDHPTPDVFVTELMKVVLNKRIQNRVIIQSFDRRTLQYLHQHYSGTATALLIEDDDTATLQQNIAALGFTPAIYSPHYSLVTAQLLQQCHAQKIKVIPWTVNKKEDIQRLRALGVDGIITDYPNLF